MEYRMFDVVFKRPNTYKWDNLKYNDMLSLDIGDMDFRLSDELLAQIHKRVEHGIFGYEFENESYYNAFIHWMERKHNINVEQRDIVCVPGVIYGIKTAIAAFSGSGSKVMVQTPVYNSYFKAIESNGRKIVQNKLLINNGKYTIDFDDFEKKIKTDNVRMFILCNPHNPVGRVWSYQEIKRMIEICKKYSVVLISDEVHQDFVFNSGSFVSACEFKDLYDKIIIATSPCKTFNVAGIHVANFIICNDNTRRIFDEEKRRKGYISNNALGIAMCENLYNNGDEWHEASFRYIKRNIKHVKDFFAEKYPRIKVIESEALYMMWIDFRCLNMSAEKIDRVFIDEMHIMVGNGLRFGDNAEGFVRINVACPNCIIDEALNRIERVLDKYY